jgi:ATP-binding cassette subfamily B protein/subfamily B ATP-binding cassette protein MsbA
MAEIIQKLNNSSNRLLESIRTYLWVIHFVRPYWGSLLFLILCSIIVGSVELTLPKFIQYLIDDIVPNQNRQLFIKLLFALSALILVMVVFMGFKNMAERRLREFAARDLQVSSFRHLRELGYSYFENTPTGESLALLNTDVAAVQQIYRVHLPGIVWRSVFAVINLALMFSIHALFTYLVIASFFLYYFVGPVLEKKSSLNKKTASDLEKDYQKQIYDSVSAVTEIKAYSSQRWVLGEFDRKYRNYAKQWLKTLAYFHFSEAFRRFTHYVGAVVVFLYGTYAVQQGQLLVGEFCAFIIYYFSAMAILTLIVSDITEQKILLIQGERLHKFALRIPTVKEPSNPVLLERIRGKITFDNVSFGYPSSAKPILNNFSLTIIPGERIALVGESGSGKTTVLKLLNRFYDPTSGTISIDGVNISSMSLGQLRDAIGNVFQETYLFGSTIRDNIAFGNPNATDESIEYAAKQASAYDFVTSTPDGFGTYIGERGVKLSGGQKQRISIARMMLKRPSILLLDEATSALDRENELEIQRSLLLFEGVTTIAVAHRLSTIRDYNRIVVMDKGSIVEIGSWDELIDAKGALYRLWKGGKLDEDGHEIKIG